MHNFWKHSTSPTRWKFKRTISTHKIKCTAFGVRKGVILVDFTPRSKTINAPVYGAILRKLWRDFQNRQRGLYSDGVILLRNSAKPFDVHGASGFHRVLSLAKPSILLNIFAAGTHISVYQTIFLWRIPNSSRTWCRIRKLTPSALNLEIITFRKLLLE